MASFRMARFYRAAAPSGETRHIPVHALPAGSGRGAAGYVCPRERQLRSDISQDLPVGKRPIWCRWRTPECSAAFWRRRSTQQMAAMFAIADAPLLDPLGRRSLSSPDGPGSYSFRRCLIRSPPPASDRISSHFGAAFPTGGRTTPKQASNERYPVALSLSGTNLWGGSRLLRKCRDQQIPATFNITTSPMEFSKINCG